MSKEQVYKTLSEVHEAFPLWEREGEALSFALALWYKATHLVTEASEVKLREKELADAVFQKLYSSLRKCLTDDLRRLLIRYHARGIGTTAAVEAILTDDAYENITPFYTFRYSNVCGFKNIKDYLVGRLSYLKPSHPRFPKKFSDLWQEERQNYMDAIKEIPLTAPGERLQKLSEHYFELESLFEKSERATDKERYHKCMMRTLAGIELMTREPVHKSLPTQLVEEKRSPALPTPETDNVIDVEVEPTVAVRNE